MLKETILFLAQMTAILEGQATEDTMPAPTLTQTRSIFPHPSQEMQDVESWTPVTAIRRHPRITWDSIVEIATVHTSQTSVDESWEGSTPPTERLRTPTTPSAEVTAPSVHHVAPRPFPIILTDNILQEVPTWRTRVKEFIYCATCGCFEIA